MGDVAPAIRSMLLVVSFYFQAVSNVFFFFLPAYVKFSYASLMHSLQFR